MHLPSTKYLRAFELAARLGSIKAAAEVLHVTPSALSRRIQNLEEELGQALFIRDTRGLTLTEAGRNYAEKLRDVFQALNEATSALHQNKRQRLKVVAPSVIMSAILPNLQSFEKIMPEVDLELHGWSGGAPSDLDIPDADIVFSWGEGQWEGWESHNITPNCHISPVCAPQMLNDGRLLTTEEISQHTWIIAIPFADGWRRWYDALGLPLPEPHRVVTVTSGQMAVEAAIHGHGILMGHGFGGLPSLPVLIGTLTYAHAFHALAPGFGHHLHIRRRPENPAVVSFMQWFFNEIWSAATVRKFLEQRTENACGNTPRPASKLHSS